METKHKLDVCEQDTNQQEGENQLSHRSDGFSMPSKCNAKFFSAICAITD